MEVLRSTVSDLMSPLTAEEATLSFDTDLAYPVGILKE